MAITAFRNMKPFSQFMFTIFVILVSFFLFTILSLIVAIPVFGFGTIMNLSGGVDLSDPEMMRILKFFQIVQSVGLFVIPPFIIAYLFYGNSTKYLYLKKPIAFNSVLLVAVIMVIVMPFINFIGEINANMKFPEWMSGIETWMRNSEDKAAELTEAFLKVDNIGGLFFNLLMIAVLPALGEELLFRGVIQRIFSNMTRNHHWGIWISAIIFSAFHLQFYGFIPRLLLGVLFGYLLVWSGSMWLPIAAHFLNNGLATIAMYFVDKGVIKPEVENIGSTSGSYYIAIISLLFVGSLLWLIKNMNNGNQISAEFNH
ncbi:MAG: CPBP family intramembrane metalloprotease [Prolixibacteraceae bacterium]|nr:CPBP family intramembrane metalloprotease [Prolixibacteraceae bacterium]